MKVSRLNRTLIIGSLICSATCASAQPNTWTYRAHMQLQRSFFGAATGPDGRIYAIGGNTSVPHGEPPGHTPTVEAYDPKLNTWTYVSPLPDTFNNSGVSAVTAPNGKIYATSGFGLVAYDTAADTWTTMAAVPDIGYFGSYDAFVVGNDGRLFLIHGQTSTKSARTQVYDPAANTWSEPNTPTPFDLPPLGQAGTAVNGIIYFTGGRDSTNQFIPYTTLYDAANDVWSNGSYLNFARIAHTVSPGGDNRLYVIGGYDGSKYLTSVEALDLSTGLWSVAPDIHTARQYASSVMGPDGKVYVLGGEASSTVFDSVECFQPQMMSASAANVTAQEGVQFNGSVASINDANKALTASAFTASIDWGDGTQSTCIVSGSAGSFAVSGTHTYAEPGTYPTKISISNSDGESENPSGQATVSDANLTCTGNNFNASSNISFSGKVASFTDGNTSPQLSDFSAAIAWGDGVVSSGTIIANGAGGFDVNGSHTFTTVGSFNLTITVKDVDGAYNSCNCTATVIEPAPSVAAVTFNATEGATYNGQVASLTDADPSLVASDFSATISWGDGSSSSGSVASNGVGGFNVTGNHKYVEEGTYPTSVSVSAKGSAPGVGNGTALVADAPLTATGYNLTCKGTIFSDTVAFFTDADPNGIVSDYTAGIVWGDGKSTNGTIVKFGSGFKVVGSHSYLKRGRYVITVHIKDEGGSTANTSTNINVGPVK